MRRQRRKRTTRPRGLAHIGDVLANILTDVEQEETLETAPNQQRPRQQPARRSHPRNENSAMLVPVPAVAVNNSSQSTFSFYQAEV